MSDSTPRRDRPAVATGGPFTVLARVVKTNLARTRGRPAWFRSSPRGARET